MSFKIDFHVHTYHSYDSINRPKQIIERARKRGLDAVVVLDHESVKGGLETSRLDTGDILVIPAVEIATDIGDIVGLFMHKEIAAREYHEVIEAMRAQGAIVMLPHPYHKHKLPDDIYELIDIVEIFNARAMPERNQMAVELAKKYNLPAVAGSDAHFPWEIGNCVTELSETPPSMDKLKIAIVEGERENHIKYSSPLGIMASQMLKYWRHPEKLWQRLKKLFGVKSG
jgi:predicted metal-dependent phosphoesterase TrpH